MVLLLFNVVVYCVEVHYGRGGVDVLGWCYCRRVGPVLGVVDVDMSEDETGRYGRCMFVLEE